VAVNVEHWALALGAFASHCVDAVCPVDGRCCVELWRFATQLSFQSVVGNDAMQFAAQQ
jgi:hypothetical protein